METTLRTNSGLYVCAELGGGGVVVANRKETGPWETFSVEQVDATHIAFKTADGQHYLTAEDGGGPQGESVGHRPKGLLVANRTGRGEWETFEVEKVDGGLALKSSGGFYVCAELGGGGPLVANRTAAGPWETFAMPSGTGTVSSSIQGRLRADSGRLRNDAGWFLWRGISEFDFVHLVQTGNESELVRRRDRAVTVGARNVFRVFARAVNLFDLNDGQPGYWEACDRAIAICNEVGAYVELCLLPDAQGLSDDKRRALVNAFGIRYREHPGVILQITNEPWQNGWSSAVDPSLLALGDLLATVLQHRDFSIGDPADGDDADASAETVKQAVELARHCNIIPIHSSRKGGAEPMAERYRRYIDHGESFGDVMAAVWKVNRNAFGINDEPMGVAGVRWVPLPGGKVYEREFEPEAVLADELTTLSIGCGHTLHYISSQDDRLPGLELLGRISPRLSADPSWRYLNDSWQGSSTRGFSGYGKVRTYTNGAEAFVTANGTNKGSVTWANGFAPNDTMFDGEHVTVWHAAH